ncbi:MAG: DUF2892 domain-containing protein [Syntrophales bacterium]|jgi:hypothetical protein|nr:DUF2892 domain-containing protein [Syntrophobacterales bacterium]MCK9363489.1 DUF2892 domain-containing protein [Syntrophales bacterium]
MKANVGGIDKWIRIILGVVIIVIGFLYKSWWGAVGLIPLLTGLFNYCGAYSLLGISTVKKAK